MSEDVRILIIDDEPGVRQVLRLALGSAEYVVCEAKDGQSGIFQVTEFHPHLILLDLGLPDINGIEVLKELRKWSTVPVIVLTVTDDEQTKVRLLDYGADDYLTKPFGTKELLARVRVALRKSGLVEATPIFISGDLHVDLSARKVTVSGRDIRLTTTEYELFSRLVRDNGKVVSQVQLLKQIWGSTAVDQSHYLRIYINQLRKKIETDPSQPRHILTEPGIGYRIV